MSLAESDGQELGPLEVVTWWIIFLSVGGGQSIDSVNEVLPKVSLRPWV